MPLSLFQFFYHLNLYCLRLFLVFSIAILQGWHNCIAHVDVGVLYVYLEFY